MFAHPRIRKAAPLPPKRRKRDHTIEDISFDEAMREEYLTGFHKRRLQRVKYAQEELAKKARQERIETRKQMREDRKRHVEEHVTQINALLKGHDDAGRIDNEFASDAENENEEWEGFADQPEPDDHEEEYIDEDKYTTVTVESVSISRDGLSIQAEDEAAEEKRRHQQEAQTEAAREQNMRKEKKEKKKKKKFTYETKFDRQLEQRKRKAKKAKAT